VQSMHVVAGHRGPVRDEKTAHPAFGAARPRLRPSPSEACMVVEPPLESPRNKTPLRPHVVRGRDLTAPGNLKRAKPTMSRRGFLSSRLGAGPLPRPPNLWLIEMLAHFLVKVVTIYRLGQEL
jgi:hypothetical protein